MVSEFIFYLLFLIVKFLGMGILSSQYKFVLDGRSWCVGMRHRSGLYQYTFTIDGSCVLDERPQQSLVEMLEPREFRITVGDNQYRVELAPISLLGYGVHVHENGRRIYRHKDRDFISMPRLRWVCAKLDARGNLNTNNDDRAFWKDLVECMIIGGVIGFCVGTLGAVLGPNSFIPSGAPPTMYAIVIGVAVALLWPKKWRFIR